MFGNGFFYIIDSYHGEKEKFSTEKKIPFQSNQTESVLYSIFGCPFSAHKERERNLINKTDRFDTIRSQIQPKRFAWLSNGFFPFFSSLCFPLLVFFFFLIKFDLFNDDDDGLLMDSILSYRKYFDHLSLSPFSLSLFVAHFVDSFFHNKLNAIAFCQDLLKWRKRSQWIKDII